MIRALLTTAVDARAILPPDVAVVQRPVGINVICPPVDAIGPGGVIVFIVVVPEIKTIEVVGAIVVADAMVGATAPVAMMPLVTTF